MIARYYKFKLAVCFVYQHVLSKMSVRQQFKLQIRLREKRLSGEGSEIEACKDCGG